MSNCQPPNNFSAERLSRLSQLEPWHFWFAGRRALLDKLLKKYLGNDGQLVLDVGIGTGLLLRMLDDKGYQVVGLDVRSEGLSAVRKVVHNPLLIQADAASLPLESNVFDAAMLLDILEHVPDSVVLEEVVRVVRPGGSVIVAVPALPWLWSYRDVGAGHLRRYSRRQLVVVLAKAQLEIVELRYYQCLLLPLTAITRLIGRKGPQVRDMEERPTRTLNAMLTWINKLEARLSDVVAWPWGSSLVAVCRKP